MIESHRNGGYACIGVGLCTMWVGGDMAREPEFVLQGLCTGAAGWSILIAGCVLFAKAKGHSPWFGLLGVLGLLGPLILFFFPDRTEPAADQPWAPQPGSPRPGPFAEVGSSPFHEPPMPGVVPSAWQQPASSYVTPPGPGGRPTTEQPTSANSPWMVVLAVLGGMFLLSLLFCVGGAAAYLDHRQRPPRGAAGDQADFPTRREIPGSPREGESSAQETHRRLRERMEEQMRQLRQMPEDWPNPPVPPEIPAPGQPDNPSAEDIHRRMREQMDELLRNRPDLPDSGGFEIPQPPDPGESPMEDVHRRMRERIQELRDRARPSAPGDFGTPPPEAPSEPRAEDEPPETGDPQ